MFTFCPYTGGMQRPPRLALMTLPTLDHFTADIVARLPAAAGIEVRKFMVARPEVLSAALDWTSDPARDMVWFEFCWPPFPAMIDAVDFGGRRVIVRVHRIEATETDHVAHAPWGKIDDAIVVSEDIRRRVLRQAPEIAFTTRLHLVPNGVDTDRFRPGSGADAKRIGWGGLMTLRKNPTLALHVLARLLAIDPDYRLHMCGMDGEPFAIETFSYQVGMLGLERSVVWDGNLPQQAMPDWHRRNAALLHTSLHESFGYIVAEAALCGCRVAMLDHPGARDVWPDEILYRTIDEAVAILVGPPRSSAQEFVRSRYGMDRFIGALAEIVRDRAHVPAAAA